MEGYFIIREHELRVREMEERAQLFRDEPRKPRRRVSARRGTTAAIPVMDRGRLNPWDATYIRTT